MLQKEPEKEKDQEKKKKPEEAAEEIFYGRAEAETKELVDWEEKFRKHQLETIELEKEREARIEESEKKEKSWEMLRVCTSYLKEN